MKKVDPRIFRAYDIRGVAHEQLTEEACFLIGKAFGSELRERTGGDHPRICVGRDARTHSGAFEKKLIEGLMETGCDVIAIGQTPSPVNYFCVCTEELDGGVQITASHNPGSDNGIKLCVSEANAFAGEDLQELKRRIEKENFVAGKGSLEEFDAQTPYEEYLSRLFQNMGTDLRIAVDSGNGVAGPLNTKILRAVGCDVTELYTQPDGTFPNHAADPSQWDTLKELQQTVMEHTLDIGVAFDGDGDRLGLVDDEGKILTADEILLLLAQDHLSRFPGTPVVYTVSNSAMLTSEIEARGGKPVMCKVGHSHVEHAMREHGALLGGEQSGHFFCGEDYFAFDDALVACLRVLGILKQSGQSLSALRTKFPRLHQAQERRPFVPDEHKNRIIDDIVVHYQKNHDVLTLDGARVDFSDGSWVGIRASNTSPRISICIEARSAERLKELEDEILRHLERYPEIDWEA